MQEQNYIYDGGLNRIRFGQGLNFQNDEIDLNIPFIETIAQGATGPQGLQGESGLDGLNGADGSIGPQGATGSIPQNELDEIIDTLNYIDSGVISLANQSEICCNKVNLKLDSISSKLQPKIIKEKVYVDVIKYRTIQTVVYRDQYIIQYRDVSKPQPKVIKSVNEKTVVKKITINNVETSAIKTYEEDLRKHINSIHNCWMINNKGYHQWCFNTYNSLGGVWLSLRPSGWMQVWDKVMNEVFDIVIPKRSKRLNNPPM